MEFPLDCGQFNNKRSAHIKNWVFFTSKFLQKENTMKYIKFINARYHTIHTNLQMVIYTIVYTQSDPVTINQ